jgi:hypothetical protein
MMTKSIRWGAAVVLGLGSLAGCGGAALPARAQTDAVAAVRSAEALGSTDTPTASYQLELARGELRTADAFIRDGHMEQARASLESAKVDAELAMALRREDQARTAALASREHMEEQRRADGTSTTTVVVPVMAPTTTTTVTTTTESQE